MKKQEFFEKASKNSFYIFLISLFIFVLSLIPASYGLGYNNGLSGSSLVGVAGQSTEGPTTEQPVEANPDIEPVEVSPVSEQSVNHSITFFTITSGLITLISGAFASLMAFLKSRLEYLAKKMELEKTRLDGEQQKKEIEILQLQLELEKKQKNKGTSKTKSSSRR